MAYLRRLALVSGGVLASMFTLLAHAFPIAAPGTEGLNVLVGNTSPIIATYLGNSAD
jgi:hypothetical protein